MTIHLNRKTLGYFASFLVLLSLVLFGFLKSFEITSKGTFVLWENVIESSFEDVSKYSGFKVLFGITEIEKLENKTYI